MTLGQRTIGATARLRVGGVFHNFIVIHHNSPGSMYQGFEGRTTLLMERVFENRQIHSSNVNDYQNSTMNAHLNGAFFNLLDADIRNQIAQVRIPFRPGSGTSPNVNTGANGLLARIFLLSQREVGTPPGQWGSLPNAEGARMDFFIDGDDATARQRRIALNQAGSAANWSLRSPLLNDSLNFWGVHSNGNAHSAWNASTAIGVRPALTLPSSLFVSDNGDISVTLPPTTPPSINVPESIIAGANVTVSWGASSDPNSPAQAITYHLERSESGQNFQLVNSGSALQATIPISEDADSVTFRVRARNTSGLESANRTSPTRNVITNQPPVIDGQDDYIGEKTGAFSYNYTVTDPDVGDIITVTERLNGVLLRNPFTAQNGVAQTLNVSLERFLTLANGTHTLTITATDQHGGTDVRTKTFSRAESRIEVLLSEPRPANEMPRRAVVTVNRQIAEGALFTVEICNNAHDPNPTWEDCTQAVENMEIYLFHNTANSFQTAEDPSGKWGVNIRVRVNRNGAAGACWISSIGGAFDSIQLYGNGGA